MRIKHLVKNLLEGIRNTATQSDRAEAEELLARLNDDRPRFAAAQPKAKKGARK